MAKVKKAKERHLRVTISLHPEALAQLDKSAKTLNVSRSRLITIAMQSLKAFESPEMEKALEKSMKRLLKEFTS